MDGTTRPTPYALLGGDAAVRRLVARFYDIMDEDESAVELRRMHARDLAPMREKLYEFLSGWLGGPSIYHQRADAKCMSQAHAPFAIGARERDQWLHCMSRVLREIGASEEAQAMVEPALRRVCEALRNH